MDMSVVARASTLYSFYTLTCVVTLGAQSVAVVLASQALVYGWSFDRNTPWFVVAAMWLIAQVVFVGLAWRALTRPRGGGQHGSRRHL